MRHLHRLPTAPPQDARAAYREDAGASKPQGGTLEREPLGGRQQPTTTDLKSPQMRPYGRPGQQAAESYVDNLQ